MLVPLLVLETGFALLLALAVARVRGTLSDRVVMIVCTAGMSISILVYIIVGQYLFGFQLGWFEQIGVVPPNGGGVSWQHLGQLFEPLLGDDRVRPSPIRRTGLAYHETTSFETVNYPGQPTAGDGALGGQLGHAQAMAGGAGQAEHDLEGRYRKAEGFQSGAEDRQKPAAGLD